MVQSLWRENSHLTEVVMLQRNGHVTLMEGEWSCYRGGQFKGGRMVLLQFNGGRKVMFNGGRMVMLREVASLMEGEWSCYRGLKERESSCYRGGQFNGGRMGHLTEVVSLVEGE